MAGMRYGNNRKQMPTYSLILHFYSDLIFEVTSSNFFCALNFLYSFYRHVFMDYYYANVQNITSFAKKKEEDSISLRGVFISNGFLTFAWHSNAVGRNIYIEKNDAIFSRQKICLGSWYFSKWYRYTLTAIAFFLQKYSLRRWASCICKPHKICIKSGDNSNTSNKKHTVVVIIAERNKAKDTHNTIRNFFPFFVKNNNNIQEKNVSNCLSQCVKTFFSRNSQSFGKLFFFSIR